MKVLVVEPGPNFSVADVCAGWSKGLRAAGCEVLTLNYADRLTFYESAHRHHDGNCERILTDEEAILIASKGIEVACYEFWPDVVLIVSGFFVPPFTYELLRARGHKIVLLHTESPYEDDRQLARAPYADVNVLNDPTNIDRFPPRTVYLPHAYDPDVHRPDGPAGPDCDVVFVGTGYPSRVQFLEQVDWTGIRLELAGNWPKDSPLSEHVTHPLQFCLPNDEAVTLYRGARSSLNLYRKEATATAEGWAMGPREVELAATGTFFLSEPRGENQAVLPMIPTFVAPDEYGELLRWYLARPKVRERITTKARMAIAERTFENNARELLERL